MADPLKQLCVKVKRMVRLIDEEIIVNGRFCSEVLGDVLLRENARCLKFHFSKEFFPLRSFDQLQKRAKFHCALIVQG